MNILPQTFNGGVSILRSSSDPGGLPGRLPGGLPGGLPEGQPGGLPE